MTWSVGGGPPLQEADCILCYRILMPVVRDQERGCFWLATVSVHTGLELSLTPVPSLDIYQPSIQLPCLANSDSFANNTVLQQFVANTSVPF